VIGQRTTVDPSACSGTHANVDGGGPPLAATTCVRVAAGAAGEGAQRALHGATASRCDDAIPGAIAASAAPGVAGQLDRFF